MLLLKVLSLLQPWASLVVLGHKTIETRSWTTVYRGPLLIHAGVRTSGKAFATLPAIAPLLPEFKELAFGAIIGEVTLRDVLTLESGLQNALPEHTLEEQAFAPGRYGFVFTDAHCFDEPIPARGKLGLWEW
ncbi:MAG: ASCH domain-containing protein [Sphingobacteriales bacterium]|nr:MAG: ASCH domain-containing protein [Sphingobacteriales bacterium]